eukprot:6409214-Alexandrium_andersonii.AAC.1
MHERTHAHACTHARALANACTHAFVLFTGLGNLGNPSMEKAAQSEERSNIGTRRCSAGSGIEDRRT